MALEFALGLVGNILVQLGSAAISQVCKELHLERDVEYLKYTLSNIKAGLSDAEEKQAQNPDVGEWLEMLQDFCFDADDLLDEMECEDKRRQVLSTTSKVLRFFSRRNPVAFRFSMRDEMKDIRAKLKAIDDCKARFNFTKQDENKHVNGGTHSSVHAIEVVGRDDDKNNIVRRLRMCPSGQNLSVIPIVGLAGMGKTTLAKLVYNDARVKSHFKLRMWAHVSVDFDATKLIRDILESATDGYVNRDSSLELLKNSLLQTLDNKRFLLILDDVWKEDREKWVEFRDLLTGGASGSKIIVTTRSQRVARLMGDVQTYNLKRLSDEDSWTVFEKCAFKGEGRPPNLIKRGREIVKKCGGVPLAVRTLGGLLYSNTDERRWKDVSEGEIWLPVFKSSFDQLPLHLKRCFAYCSMFPKGYEFNSDHLIQFWMAHDLIQPEPKKDLEYIGEQYIEELLSRLIFQEVSCNYNFTFKMDDLFHDFATSVAQSTCSTVNSRTRQQDVSKMVRHLSFSDPNLPRLQDKRKGLRTIIFHNNTATAISSSFLATSIIPRFKHLRLLNLSRSRFKVLPSSISDMRHLRYLDLSWNGRIVELPKSIRKLQSLQTLKLDGCVELKRLPKKIRKMISLKFLEITTKERHMPGNEIARLRSLRFLKFEECENLQTLFRDMQHLASLRTLVISNCCHLQSLPAYLSSLKTLVISNCGSLDLHNNYLSELKLRSLVLEELPQLKALPRWLQGSDETLVYMSIESCLNLESLPEWLQHFSSLQTLVLRKCRSLSPLSGEMRGLTALRKLEIIVD